MRGTLTQLLFAAGLVLVGGAALAGCKQGQNERCEVNSDCQAGLVCNPTMDLSNGVCQPNGTQSVDASTDVRLSDTATLVTDVGSVVDQGVSPDVAPVAADGAAPDAAHEAGSDVAADSAGAAPTDASSQH